jgi:hypothetical protein
MMKTLAENVIQHGEHMIKAFHFQGEIPLFPQSSTPVVLGIKIPGVDGSHPEHEFFGRICLDSRVVMGRQKILAQSTGLRHQRSNGKSIEPHGQIGLVPKHDFFMGRKTEMIRLPHRGILLSFSLISPAPLPLREPFASSENTVQL